MKDFSKPFKITMSVICVFTIIITSIMDLNNTHMTNPLWPAHARFHWSIQYLSILALNVIALYCIWKKYDSKGTKLSILVIGFTPIMFWGMFFPSLLMPGTDTWPDGIAPPENFPEIFKSLHPNLIIAFIITILTIILTRREITTANTVYKQ